jgi:tetratricopeptide (TPR) repeat protein
MTGAPGVMGGLWGLGWMLVLAALGAETSGRAGAGLLGLFGRVRYGALERFGLGFMAWWLLLGTGYLGLGLVGLFHPYVLIGLAAAMAAGSRGAWARGCYLLDAARECRPMGKWGLIVLGLAFLPAALRMLTFDNEATSFTYHLGYPWHLLVERWALLENVCMSYHLPLPVDASMALGLLTGDDRLTKWEAGIFFWCAAAVYASQVLREGGRRSAWLGPLLMMVNGYVLTLFGTSKNDLAAAALFVGGALLVRRGSWSFGSLLLGLCAAAKYTNVPAIAVWVLYCRPPARKWGWVMACLVLPITPWLAKSWLATGNPVYPLAGSVFHAYDWSAMNESVVEGCFHNALRGSYRWGDLPGLWLSEMRGMYLIVLLVGPAALLMGRRVGVAVAVCLASQVLTIGLRHDGRYLVGSVMLMCLFLADGVERVGGVVGRRLPAVLGAYGIVYYAAALFTGGYDIGKTVVRGSDYGRREIPYQAGVLERLRELGAVKVISVGEERTYLFPCRLLYGGMEGETPLIWKAVKESMDERGIAKRFRQFDARYILHNYVSVDWFTMIYRVFPWDARMVRRYVEYMKRYAVVLYQTESSDYHRGGYYIIGLQRAPAKKPAREIWVAPGIEPMFWQAQLFRINGRYSEALALFLGPGGLLERAGDVGETWNTLGRLYAAMGDAANGYKYFSRFADQGMRDAFNLPLYGATAVRIGRLEVGEKVLQESIRRFPDHLPIAYMNLAWIRIRRAAQDVEHGRMSQAEALVREANEFARRVPEGRINVAMRLSMLANLKALEGQMCLIRKEYKPAADLLREALNINPQDEMASHWLTLLNTADSRATAFGR